MLDNIKKINFLITKPQRKRLIILTFLLVIGMFLEVFGLGMLFPVITFILDSNSYEQNIYMEVFLNYFEINNNDIIINYFLLIILIIFILKTIFTVFLTLKQNRFLASLNAHIKNSLFKKYINSSYGFFVNSNTASLVKNLELETHYFGIYCLSLTTIVIEVSLATSILGFLVFLEPFGALCLGLFFGILSVIFYYFFKSKLSLWGVNREILDDKISKTMLDSFGSVKDIKILGKENYFYSLYSKLNKEKFHIGSNHSTISQLPRYYLELVSILGLVFFIFLMLFQGTPPNSLIAILGVLVAAVFKLIPSLNRIISAFQNLKYYSKSIGLLYDAMQDNRKMKEGNEVIEFNYKIEFEKINFRYAPNKDLIFQDLSFQVKKGQTYGIIGKSGAGKSTFVDLLTGLIQPIDGKISVDGVLISNNYRSWLNKIGYVSQDIPLLNNSILSNIALGVPENEIDLELIYNCIKSAQLDDFIDKSTNGIYSDIGDKGIQISGGQKQRIGIARALYSRPEILILDEATSALDEKTEAEVMSSIELLSKDKTVFIISHRLTTLSFCDQIFELQNKKLIELK